MNEWSIPDKGIKLYPGNEQSENEIENRKKNKISQDFSEV